jgi:hypothetical protein
MSVEQLQEQIQCLPQDDSSRPGSWLDRFL